MLKALLLLAGVVAAVYVGLVRSRGWHVDHYEPPARRAHFFVCIAVAIVLASATVYLLRDAILCPSGTVYSDVVIVPAQAGKKGVGIECLASSGTPAKGSTFTGVLAWFGMLVVGFAGSSAIWRRFGPPAPPALPSEEPSLEPPTDKRDKRRERKREQHARSRRGTRNSA